MGTKKIVADDAGALRKRARLLASDFGKFYTPECLCRLLTRLAGKPGRVLDPACGCGQLLVYAADYLGDSFYVGQEINAESCELARKNLHENGIDRHEIINCDTLEFPITWEEKFDCVLANPPFSIKWNPDAVPFDPRFNVYAPRGKADLAFVQHGLFWLQDGGTAGYILFPGALYRGGAEQKIREQFLPYVRAVVALPAKLFDETAIATALVLFEKAPSDEPILFVDASQMYEAKQKKLNVVSDEQVAELVSIVTERREIEERSKLVERSAIKNCNLSPNVYVEKKIEKANLYDGRSLLEVIRDGEAYAEYSYRHSLQMYANLRKTMGYEYNQADLDFDVEAIKPETYDYMLAEARSGKSS
ncbi:MAG: N-6 DNA methylase [Thermoguttaceae bacterium]|nr:N-6 DNA methylase [Thermoguttaceae bacterium]